MHMPLASPRWILYLRWSARIWTLLLLLMTLLITVSPQEETGGGGSMPLHEYLELGFLVAALAGLVLAWRWEAAGGIIALLGVLGNHLAFLIGRGSWHPGLLVPGLAVILPAVVFLFVHSQAQRELKEW